MEVQSRGMNYPSHDGIQRRNYYEGAGNDHPGGSRRGHENYAGVPSLTEQIRQSSRKRLPQKDDDLEDSANQCIENNFDIPSAKSIAYSLANPCGLTPTDLPATPSTACDGFSDDSEDSSPSTSFGALESRRFFLAPKNVTQSSPTRNPKDGDLVIFVGSQEFRFPSSGSSMNNFAAKYFLVRREDAENFSFVDLSTHSPEEFKLVMKFFENNPTRGAWRSIHWKNLAVILPWFVEFQALPLMSAVDTFLLQNGFSAPGERAMVGDIHNRNRPIGLSSLLALMQVAFDCGLESTKLHSRRLLRRWLLEPRKKANPDLDSSRLSESGAEDIELEWTLHDLQVLAKLLKNHKDLREYLWEVAVIIYLPHDLDISDSVGLVSNSLFPFLLREGMMQMMIVEGIESSFQTTDNSFITESSGTQSILSKDKAVGSSFSEHTSCSDATIPTTPSSHPKYLTEKEIYQYLRKIIKQLEKFKAEKEERIRMQEDEVNNSMVAQEEDAIEKERQRRAHTSIDGSTKVVTSRGVTTFEC